jgi:hypothetical protein
MSSWGPDDEKRVNPTVRWLMRGLWTVGLIFFVILLIGAITTVFD